MTVTASEEFVLPERFRAKVLRRRGDGGGSTPITESLTEMTEWMDDVRGEVEDFHQWAITNPESDPELVEAATRPGFDDLATASPLQAGLRAALVYGASGYPVVPHRFVDSWVLSRGRAFAVRALAELHGVCATRPGRRSRDQKRKNRQMAARTLRWLGDKNGTGVVAIAAEAHGDKAAAAIKALMISDGAEELPKTLPKVPRWAESFALPQIALAQIAVAQIAVAQTALAQTASAHTALADGAVGLPPEAVHHLGQMLALSASGEPYAGIEDVQELCDAVSLREYAWALFDNWRLAGYPNEFGWALTALRWFGDDEVVRRLAPLVRVWPGEGGHTRAVDALDVFAAIGTDLSLTTLSSDDDLFAPSEGVLIGIAHPLDLGASVGKWSDVLADYQILQPFAQLGRQPHALADDERSCLVLKRFAGIDMPAGRVFGLTRRGWRRGEPWGDGYEMHIERPLPDGRVVIANIRPGIAVGFVSEAEDQCFADIWISRDGEADYRPVPEWSDPFGTLDPVTASEILRDLTEVTAQ